MSARLLGLHPASRALRALRSRRLAIVLLITLIMLSAMGTAAPQQAQVGPDAYAQWTQENPRLAGLASQMSLDSLYSAWWFLALFALLYVNTLGCTLPQLRAAWARTVRPPRLAAVEGRATAHEMGLFGDGSASLALAAEALRRRGYRVWALPNSLVGRKGSLAAWGSPIFHLGLVAVFTGAAIGGLMGFSGYVEVGEGQGFLESKGSYIRSSQGPLFDRDTSLGQLSLLGVGHRGFGVRLDRLTITASNWGTDIPSQIESEVTVFEGGQEVSRGAIRINEALEHRGLSIYPTGASGLGPVFEIELPDGSRNTGMVNLARKDHDRYENTLYLPGTIYRMAVHAREGDQGMEVEVFERRRSLFVGRLEPGQAVMLGEAILTLKDVRRWTGLRVVADPGKMVLYLGFGLTVLGLAMSFLLVRREVWVGVDERSDGCTLRLGGHAPRVKALQAAELEELAEALQAPRKGEASPARTGSSTGVREEVEAWTSSLRR